MKSAHRIPSGTLIGFFPAVVAVMRDNHFAGFPLYENTPLGGTPLVGAKDSPELDRLTADKGNLVSATDIDATYYRHIEDQLRVDSAQTLVGSKLDPYVPYVAQWLTRASKATPALYTELAWPLKDGESHLQFLRYAPYLDALASVTDNDPTYARTLAYLLHGAVEVCWMKGAAPMGMALFRPSFKMAFAPSNTSGQFNAHGILTIRRNVRSGRDQLGCLVFCNQTRAIEAGEPLHVCVLNSPDASPHLTGSFPYFNGTHWDTLHDSNRKFDLVWTSALDMARGYANALLAQDEIAWPDDVLGPRHQPAAMAHAPSAETAFYALELILYLFSDAARRQRRPPVSAAKLGAMTAMLDAIHCVLMENEALAAKLGAYMVHWKLIVDRVLPRNSRGDRLQSVRKTLTSCEFICNAAVNFCIDHYDTELCARRRTTPSQ